MKSKRFLPAWQCDSADDYYAQFEQKEERKTDPDDDMNVDFMDQNIKYHNGDRG
ncbi:hypothetical protein ABWE90_01370 [Pasteurella multocida]|uniref:hypothetical protein n=1 Tax=Pasteurella multocida TaxID=747 RepID=UPI0002839183|nr:hypothetical protein [Pasteurella multocida]EJZ80308.1 hypothetical protein P1059_00746 [Pasteurella multocida subsp. gallicida P1059]NMR51794.1 hypothetical protein [Pasteurella multocida]NMR61734.1 hypothetical protein [Pasteurella multocida]URK10831.1 hypothetical protein M9410_05135 [Pasteurella multocida]HDR0631121.1 hypothetical protein [Pasteurella multocida]